MYLCLYYLFPPSHHCSTLSHTSSFLGYLQTRLCPTLHHPSYRYCSHEHFPCCHLKTYLYLYYAFLHPIAVVPLVIYLPSCYLHTRLCLCCWPSGDRVCLLHSYHHWSFPTLCHTSFLPSRDHPTDFPLILQFLRCVFHSCFTLKTFVPIAVVYNFCTKIENVHAIVRKRFTLLLWILKCFAFSTVYVIDVATANKAGAGTDAHVFITMFGKRGKTPKTQLVNR